MAKGETYTPAMSNAAVKAKTGRDWYGWFQVLDKKQAHKLAHKDIATLLYGEHEVPGWWAQMVTVEYERARGLREKHEQTGGYSVAVSKTMPVAVDALYRAFSDAKLRAQWFPKGKVEPGKCTENKYWRGKWNGSARLEVGFYAKEGGKSQVAIQVSRLAKKSDVEKERAAWKKAVEKLAAVVA
jgi:hypothetical protein